MSFPPIKSSKKTKKSSNKRSTSDESKSQVEEEVMTNGVTQNEFPASDLDFQGSILEILGLLSRELVLLFKQLQAQEMKKSKKSNENEPKKRKSKKKNGEESIASDIEKTQQYLIQEFNV